MTVKGWGRLQNLQYSSDGKSFCCGSTLPDGSALFRIDLEGRFQAPWHQKGAEAVYASTASPDRRQLAFSSVVNNSNIWIVEGF